MSIFGARLFQSTPSGGKATLDFDADDARQRVSIHAFRGEGDRTLRAPAAVEYVSIHAFRGEGDSREPSLFATVGRFNPRLPGGRRLIRGLRSLFRIPVSIHAFRGEGDSDLDQACVHLAVFQSTPSGGKATGLMSVISTKYKFQSTPSGGKATQNVSSARRWVAFQSTPSGGKATPTRRMIS